MRARLEAAIAELPVPFRETLVLRDVQGLDYREIAEVTGVPIGTVMSRLARARQPADRAASERTSAGGRVMTRFAATDPRLLVHAYVDGELDPAHALEIERQFASDPALAAERDRVEALRASSGSGCRSRRRRRISHAGLKPRSARAA